MTKAWNLAHPAEMGAYRRKWRLANRETDNAAARRRYRINRERCRLRGIWDAMRQRCGNKRHAAYALYGARGIQVVYTSFAEFVADLGPRPTPAHTVDRINNDGNYEMGNCRWASRKEQATNRRPQNGTKKTVRR